jgi:hypothetical protein
LNSQPDPAIPIPEKTLEYLVKLSTIDLFCLDLLPQDEKFNLIVRIGGLPDSFPSRFERLQGIFDGGEIIEGDAESELWREVRELSWVPENARLVKIPLTPRRIPALDSFFSGYSVPRRYTVAGNLAWVAWAGDPKTLHEELTQQQLSGLAIMGPPGSTRLGVRTGATFANRIKRALDPQGRWMEV